MTASRNPAPKTPPTADGRTYSVAIHADGETICSGFLCSDATIIEVMPVSSAARLREEAIEECARVAHQWPYPDSEPARDCDADTVCQCGADAASDVYKRIRALSTPASNSFLGSPENDPSLTSDEAEAKERAAEREKE